MAKRDSLCFVGVGSYLTAFLFFIETETTVGYGRRNIQSNCPGKAPFLEQIIRISSEAVLALVIQCLIGTFVDAVMVGCIFIKLSKPTNRTDTLIFSTDAVISQVQIAQKSLFHKLSVMENTASCFELEICAAR